MENKVVYIQKWFMANIKSDFHNNFNFFTREATVVHETEKAYKVLIECSRIDGEWDGDKLIWVPKKCTMTAEEYEAEKAAAEKRFEDGCKAYDQLLSFAKANGVKGVRSGMRKSTILQKMREAGVAYA